MDFIKNTVLCLIAAAAVGTVAMVLVPRGAMDKTLRAVIGIFVVAVVCSPLSELQNGNLTVNAFADFEESNFNKSYSEDMNSALINTFRTALDYSLNEIAAELKIEIVSVDTDISVDDEQCIIIHEITITVTGSELYNMEELSRIISEKLGLPVDVSEE